MLKPDLEPVVASGWLGLLASPEGDADNSRDGPAQAWILPLLVSGWETRNQPKGEVPHMRQG